MIELTESPREEKDNTMSSLFNEIKQLKQELQKKLSEFGEPAIFEGVYKPVFDAHPDLDSITWRQYTPGFNDGDPCVFSVYGFDFQASKLAEELGYDEEEEFGEDGIWLSWNYDQETLRAKGIDSANHPLLKKYDAVQSAVERAHRVAQKNEDVWEQVFGDGVEVTVTRNGKFSTEYYDCGY